MSSLPQTFSADVLATTPSAAAPLPAWLLNPQVIYVEPAVEQFVRGRQILARFPRAERITVDSHWKIPGLFGFEGNVADWNKIKRDVLVLGVKKSLRAEPNSRSSDFIAPSHANGCAMSCSYCYVPRQKGYANPISIFVNIEQIAAYHDKLHQINLGWHPRGEELLWKPELQETKYSQMGGCNLRYKRGLKSGLVGEFSSLLSRHLPECQIRYAF